MVLECLNVRFHSLNRWIFPQISAFSDIKNRSSRKHNKLLFIAKSIDEKQIPPRQTQSARALIRNLFEITSKNKAPHLFSAHSTRARKKCLCRIFNFRIFQMCSVWSHLPIYRLYTLLPSV